MRNLIALGLIFVLVFSTTALGAKKNVVVAKTGSAIVGEITSVADGTITVKEDGTGKEDNIRVTKAQLKGLKEGYRVEARVSKGMARTIKVIGITNPSQG